MMPSTKIAQMVPLPEQKGAARALDKKYVLMAFSPEPLVQIQNNSIELFLVIISPEIAQTVSIDLIPGSTEL